MGWQNSVRIWSTDTSLLAACGVMAPHSKVERRQMMWAGTGFHQLFDSGVSSEEFLDQFLEYFSMNRLHPSSRPLL